MSRADYDSRSSHRPRHDSYYAPSRDTDAYSRHEPREKLIAMRGSGEAARRPYYDSYEPRASPPSRRPAAPPQHRNHARKHTWPPSPSVEEETVALTKEVRPVGGQKVKEGEPPINTRGTIDQEIILEDIELPDDRRYVLVSDPSTGDSSPDRSSNIRDRRRRSFADRGNMPHIKTDVDPPVFTERISTPYAYTKPQKESTAPSPSRHVLSPEPLTPPSASTQKPHPRRDEWEAPKDQNARPSKSTPSYNRHDSFSKASRPAKDDVFDDSDTDPETSTYLRTAERKPARYSFVKSDLQKEDLRANVYNSQPKPQPRRRDSGQRPPPLRHGESPSAPKEAPYAQSPRSSTSSLSSGNRKPRPPPVETGHHSNSRTTSRPSSPVHRAPSPKLPSRLRDSPPISRPSSRGGTRPASPLSFSTTLRPASPSHIPVTDADWHATYPPFTASDRSRPPSRFGRHETMQVPAPRIDVQSPSPARPAAATSALPYPVDDGPIGVFMPSEQHYQFDHATVASPRQAFPDSPRFPSTTIPGSPRLRDEPTSILKNRTVVSEEPARSNSVRTQASPDLRREPAKLDIDRPLPSCPRSTPTAKYDDWFSLKRYPYFHVCPSCYDGAFANTPFADRFTLTRPGDRPIELVCDFSSPWTRLAWLLTIKQRRSSLELIYALADIAEEDRPCPDERAVGSDRVTWYGIPDQRDGVPVANFAICSSDRKMISTLFPTIRGYFVKQPSTYSSSAPNRHLCSLRASSRRFPKYLDLLVELDAEAQDLSQRPNITRFVQMARDNAFKGECSKHKPYFRKPWHFIPSLPEFTVCEECYDELIWPAIQSKASSIPRLFNKAIQLVPNEDVDVGSTCCLYSSRMRRVWETSVKEDDFAYLKKKAVDRKRVEARLARERKGLVNWMAGLERGSSKWEVAKSEMKGLEREWALWE
jgi:hypothetical protein